MFLSSINFAFAQEEIVTDKTIELKAPPSYKNSSVNVEFLGSNRYYALNFEQILLRKGMMNLYASVGGTYMPPIKLRNYTPYQVIAYNVEAGTMWAIRKTSWN